MSNLNEEQRRELIVQYKVLHPQASRYSVAQYFKQLGISESTVYRTLKKFDEEGDVEREKGSGRVPSAMTSQKEKKLVGDALGEKTFSQRDLAKKYDISQPYVNKILKRNHVKAFKKEKIPFSTEKQKETQMTRIGRLYRSFFAQREAPAVIMDDESYFPLSNSNLPGNSFYYATSRGDASDSVKYAPKKKFEEKIMVWLAISPSGISAPYIVPSRMAVTKEIYVKECIQKRLLPFIQENHNDGKYIFWPDLASSHYAKLTVDTMNEMGINFVAKELNPPCVPQMRPVEDFWGILKTEVYRGNWRAKNLDQLKNRIRYCLNKIDKGQITSMMEDVKKLLRKAKDDGPSSCYH